MARILCMCGKYLNVGTFPTAFGFKMFSEKDYDEIDDPVNRNTLEKLFLHSTSVYECIYCGKLLLIKKDGDIEYWSKELV